MTPLTNLSRAKQHSPPHPYSKHSLSTATHSTTTNNPFSFTPGDNFLFSDVLSPPHNNSNNNPIDFFSLSNENNTLACASFDNNNNNSNDIINYDTSPLISILGSSSCSSGGSTFASSPEVLFTDISIDNSWDEVLQMTNDAVEEEEESVEGDHKVKQEKGDDATGAGKEWEWVSQENEICSSATVGIFESFTHHDQSSPPSPTPPSSTNSNPVDDDNDTTIDNPQLRNFSNGVPSLSVLPRQQSSTPSSIPATLPLPPVVGGRRVTGSGSSSSSSRNGNVFANNTNNVFNASPAPMSPLSLLPMNMNGSMLWNGTTTNNNTNTNPNISQLVAQAQMQSQQQQSTNAHFLAQQLSENSLMDLLVQLQTQQQQVQPQPTMNEMMIATLQAQAQSQLQAQAQEQARLVVAQQQQHQQQGQQSQTLDFAALFAQSGIGMYQSRAQQQHQQSSFASPSEMSMSVSGGGGSSLAGEEEDDEGEEEEDEGDDDESMENNSNNNQSITKSSTSTSSSITPTTSRGRQSTKPTSTAPTTHKRGRKPSPKDILNAPTPSLALTATLRLERRRSINRRSARTLREKRKSELAIANERSEGLEERIRGLEEELKEEREWRRRVEGLLSGKVGSRGGGGGSILVIA